jgi:hypothetical protein
VSTAYHIAYIDCLFLCMSSMTVTGLATVDLSTLSAFQQFILFFQQIIGSLVSPNTDLRCSWSVSLIMLHRSSSPSS